MMKRKNGVKKVLLMVTLVLVFIASNPSPTLAATSKVDITILDDFVVEVKNCTNDTYKASIKVSYFDANNEKIRTEIISRELGAFEVSNIDAKSYFDSQNIHSISAEDATEELIHEDVAIFLIILLGIVVIAFIILAIRPLLYLPVKTH